MNARPLALALVLATPLAGQQGFEHVLPADAFFFVGVADVEAWGESFRSSSAGRFWYDPGNAALRAVLEDRVDALTSQMHAELGVDPLDFVDLLHGRLALASVGTPTAEDLHADGPRGFAVVLLADVGEDRADCEKLVSALADRLATDLGAVRKSTLAGETEVSVLEIDGNPDDDASVRMKHAFHGETLVVAVEAHPMAGDSMETLLARLDGEPGETLGQLPRFRGSLAAEPGGLQAWVDLGRIVQLVRSGLLADDEDHERELDVMERLGLFDLGCLAMNSRYTPDGSRMDLSLDWTGGGWIPSFARLLCVSGPTTTLAAVPKDCLSAIAARVDFAGMFDAVVKLLVDMGRMSASDVVEFLAGTEETLGFNLRDDLLEALDGQVTLVTSAVEPEDAMPFVEGDPQNVVLILGLRDGAAVGTLVEDAVRRAGLHAARKRTEFQGYEIYNVPLFPHFAVNYAILPDMAVLSLSPALLQDVLRRKAGADLPTLDDDDDFKARLAALVRLPGLLQYTNTAENMKGALRALSGMSALLEGMGDELGPLADLFGLLEDLPPTDEALIDKHFKGASVTAMVVDDQGVLVQAVSP